MISGLSTSSMSSIVRNRLSIPSLKIRGKYSNGSIHITHGDTQLIDFRLSLNGNGASLRNFIRCEQYDNVAINSSNQIQFLSFGSLIGYWTGPTLRVGNAISATVESHGSNFLINSRDSDYSAWTMTVRGAQRSSLSNVVGGDCIVGGGAGTGTGNGGNFLVKVGLPTTSSSTTNTYTTVFTISGANGGVSVTTPAATTIPLTITGAASQSANLINVTANGGSAGGLLAFTAAGRLNIGGTTIDSLGRHLNVVSTTPGIGLYESDVTTDEKGWDMAAAASTFSFRCFNDAMNAASNIFTVTRSGYVPNHMKIFPALEVSSYHYTTYTNNGNSGAAKTIDWSASPVQRITLDASCTLTFTAPNGISDVLLHITQNGTGGYSVTWPAAVKWSGGIAPTITTTAGAVSVVRLFYDGATYWGDYTLDVR